VIFLHTHIMYFDQNHLLHCLLFKKILRNFLFWGTVLEFELRALQFLGRCSTLPVLVANFNFLKTPHLQFIPGLKEVAC
jgi:hypothetical protein